MGGTYIPNAWSRKYQQITQTERAAVNQETNRLFADRTGVTRKLDPKLDQDLVVKWLQTRDEVMQTRAASPAPTKAATAAPKPSASPSADVSYDDADEMPTRWLEIAREELALGVMEIPGAKHNPRIMQYIYTCPNIFENPTYSWAKRHPTAPRRSDQEIDVEPKEKKASTGARPSSIGA